MAEIENVSYQLNREQVRESAHAVASELEEEIKKGEHDGAFAIILAIALFKDFGEILLDISIIGLLAVTIVGWFFSFILYLVMRQYGWMEAEKELKRKIQIAFWGLSFFIDGIPVVDALPLTTITIFYIRKIIKERAAIAAQELEDLQYITTQEINRAEEEEMAYGEIIEQTNIEEQTSGREAMNSVDGSPEQTSDKLNIIGEEPEELASEEREISAPKKAELSEAEEEAAAGFIPKKVRDPLGKLKKDYFETPPDERFDDDNSFKEAA